MGGVSGLDLERLTQLAAKAREPKRRSRPAARPKPAPRFAARSTATASSID